MSFMNDSGADCGPVNPMAGLMKQFGQDRSLQQDRFGLEQRGESSKSGFRTRNAPASSSMQGSQMADEFFRDEMNHPIQSPYTFNGMSRELERLQQQQRPNDWLADFKQHQSSMEPTEQFKEFDMIYQQHQKAPLHSANWAHDFETFQVGAPTLNAVEREAFEKAFEEAGQKTVSWESEFKAQEANDWTTEFEQQQQQNVTASTDNEALAKTAGLLLDSVDVDSNPKFKNSQFMNLMRRLRDSEVAIQGDKMVETKSGHDWASEFNQQKSDWIGEFANSQPKAGNMWSDEFAKKVERNWTGEFHQEQKQHQLPGDWATEFQKNDQLHTLYGKGTEAEDWVEQYNRNISHLKETQDHEWDAMQRDWEHFQPGQGYRAAANPEYNTYQFSTTNPYLLNPALIDQGIQSDHLADAILALEAKAQLQTSNADAWQSLGLRQQENERDGAAIAALRQALSMNPRLLDGWLALAVSYTNENCRADAYDALEQWIANHDQYSHLIQSNSTPEGRHAYITRLFLEAARSAPGEQMDPDVQVGLGVLFNMSEEYDKAIDCFQAALASRPRDYLLWNKLGATLANSRNPTGAIDAYFNALEINPTYIRARYNLAISCINLGQQREAAEHLLTALALQKSNSGSDGSVMVDDKGQSIPIPGGMSDNIWSSLRMLMSSMSREDLANECDRHNLDAFRSSFEF
ncbi:Peroxisomal targeting signal 1 receptor [Choanephora cucurbitarum]|uniref:Peroxisomal targeting signal 1 receptor n=1 Tax=Choanephora cucurbitarum TaxID=101091 RepID=A0A1C7NBE9_9FUNG|nr:Peroxisomal targeting signal 1 receptor [Choanephora cucurbitarum]